MKKILVLLLAAGVFVSCTTTTDSSADEAKAAAKAKAEENVALVEKYITAFETGDYDMWKELCSEDYVSLGPGLNAEIDLDGLIESMKSFDEAVDSLETHKIAILPHTVEEGDLAGDYVFWWGSNSAYFVEAGKSAELPLHTVYCIEEGKIAWSADYWDSGDLKRQLSDDSEKKKEKE